MIPWKEKHSFGITGGNFVPPHHIGMISCMVWLNAFNRQCYKVPMNGSSILNKRVHVDSLKSAQPDCFKGFFSMS